MIREIKTTLAIDGERQFKEALASANREMRVMNADLRAMAAEFSATDDAQKYFAQRSEMLNDKVKQQEQIVEALSQAVKDSADKYGSAARQTDDYRIKLSNATASLYKMRQEAEDAAKELEDLGRDSNKIGRQIENGIGDAAEDTADKLDRMFERVSQDVEALKSSTAYQTAIDVGGFVMQGIESVMGFVEENDEYNRQIAIARHNVERYGHNWDDALNMIIDAAAITGNREGAFEAISNLTSSAVEDQELIGAAVDALLGVFLTSGGALSFESLAEDFRASVTSRVPTGTYAEVLEEILGDVLLEDVEKALGNAKSADEAFQLALAYLTKGGFQTTTKTFEEQNAEFLESQRKQQELAKAWAELAQEATPIVSAVVDLTTEAVGMLTEMVANLKENVSELQEIVNDPAGTVLSQDWHKENLQEDYPEFSEALENGAFDSWESTWKYFMENMFPSAGAEALPMPISETDMQTNYEEKGALAGTAFTDGMLAAIEKNPAMQQVMADYLAGLSAENEAAAVAGNNAMISFANGIAQGSPIVMSNVTTLVNAINQALASISMPAIGYGLNGITGGNIYVSGEEVTNAVSKHMRRGVDNRKLTFR